MQNSGNAGCSIDTKLSDAKPPDSRQTRELEVFKPWSLVDGIGFGVSLLALITRGRCVKSPNDSKLTDCGGRGWLARRLRGGLCGEQPP